MSTEDVMRGFHRVSREERLRRVQSFCDLSDQEMSFLSGERPISPDLAENFIENVVGYFPMPLGMATYFNIDGRDLLIPMAVEETSIIAAASASAKWIAREGGITTHSKGRLIIGQIQLPYVKDVERFRRIIQDNRQVLIRAANGACPSLVRRGGGVQDISIRVLEDLSPALAEKGRMVVLHVLANPCDAMGANIINQVCETLKPLIEEITMEKVGICILSNLVDTKLAGAEVVIRNIDPRVGQGIVEACTFAAVDPYRATTHNKGVINGIDPILIATGNDWRAVEAGVHAYSARSGFYRPVTNWEMVGQDLVGRIEIPMALGIVGGVTRSHPFAQIALKIMQIESAEQLGRICAAVGLVQNLGALKALSTVGIVKGHMQLHAANLAIAAGAERHEIGRVRAELTQILRREKCISLTQAREILSTIRTADGSAS